MSNERDAAENPAKHSITEDRRFVELAVPWLRAPWPGTVTEAAQADLRRIADLLAAAYLRESTVTWVDDQGRVNEAERLLVDGRCPACGAKPGHRHGCVRRVDGVVMDGWCSHPWHDGSEAGPVGGDRS